ncbi:hypothetical protein GYB22_00200 [bacterium]|nr:hypothetical protein [bacterium]
MKTQKLKLILTGLILVFLAACAGEKDDSQDNTKLEEFITKLETKWDTDEGKTWLKENWEEMQDEYQLLSEELEPNWDETQLDERWNAIKESVAEYKDDVKDITLMKAVYTTIGMSSVDATMEMVTKENVAQIYKAFVDEVKENKDEYSKEDWIEIESLWERLKTRSDELKPMDDAETVAKIAAQKSRYIAIKAVNRPTAETE